jgi:hypothetical protein
LRDGSEAVLLARPTRFLFDYVTLFAVVILPAYRGMSIEFSGEW